MIKNAFVYKSMLSDVAGLNANNLNLAHTKFFDSVGENVRKKESWRIFRKTHLKVRRYQFVNLILLLNFTNTS